ncbi:hypothetical protein [Bradyrhizobium liaoningense]|uniref:hypothetical protein n=1 Tax=Bradyrhizobium liaoningense TaxID=43992 RepID=UPI0012FDA5F6|nr:hypothetical protein [Bradyrhizobium liaoningense]
MNFYLWMYAGFPEACIFAALCASVMQFVQTGLRATGRKQGRQKLPRPSFGVIDPENNGATPPTSRCSRQMGSPPVPATWGIFFDHPIDCAP